jgi:hypothetical protein
MQHTAVQECRACNILRYKSEGHATYCGTRVQVIQYTAVQECRACSILQYKSAGNITYCGTRVQGMQHTAVQECRECDILRCKGMEVQLYPFMTSALEEDGWSAPCPGRFTPGSTRYQLYRMLSGSRVRSGLVRKVGTSPGLEPRTAQPLASGYTD